MRIIRRFLDAVRRADSWVVRRKLHFVAAAFLGGAVWTSVAPNGISEASELWAAITRLPRLGLSWWIVGILTIPVLLQWALTRYARKRDYALALAKAYESRIDPYYQHLSRGRIAWGSQICLVTCPDLPRGWPIADVGLDAPTFHLETPPATRAERDALIDSLKADPKTRDRVKKDNPEKLSLARVPTVYSDSPGIRLALQTTTYYDVLYTKEVVAARPVDSMRYLKAAVRSRLVTFPHSLCLHLAVVTRDHYLLVTRRSQDVEWFPGAWSCSIEEQAKREDLAAGTALRWGTRALEEELAVTSKQFEPMNFRVFALFLEAPVLNIAVAAVAQLGITRAELQGILERKPRTDYEFDKWVFFDWNRVIRELKAPSRAFHPSSGLRMFYAALQEFGADAFHDQLLASAPVPARSRT